MTVLALTWHGYYTAILAGAGFIGAIGGALAYLTSWGRSVYNLMRHHSQRRQAKAAAPERPREPTPEQIRVMNTVYRYFCDHGKPAPFWELDKVLDRQGVSLRAQAESMPPGLLLPNVSHRGGAFHTDDELLVTADGLRYCTEGMSALDMLARVLAFMAAAEKSFMRTSRDSQLVVQAAQVKRELDLSPVGTEQALILVENFEPNVYTGIYRPTTTSPDWSLAINLENIRRFRGIRNGAEYLLARAGAQSFAHRLSDKAVHDD